MTNKDMRVAGEVVRSAVNDERERCVKVVRTATLPTIPQWVLEGGFGEEFSETIDDIVARIEDPYLP